MGIVYLLQDLYVFVIFDGMPVWLFGEFLDIFIKVEGVVFISQGIFRDLVKTRGEPIKLTTSIKRYPIPSSTGQYQLCPLVDISYVHRPPSIRRTVHLKVHKVYVSDMCLCMFHYTYPCVA